MSERRGAVRVLARTWTLTIMGAIAIACARAPGSGAGGAGDSAAARIDSAAAPAPEQPVPITPGDTIVAGGTRSREAPPPDSAVQRLEREARALAKVDDCGGGECATAPVGSRACGGPRGYLAYCPTTTDTTALLRTLRELERAEQAYNERSGMASTCEFRMPPRVANVGGRCELQNGVE